MLEEALLSSGVLGRNRAVWIDAPGHGHPDGLTVILDAENYLCNVGIAATLEEQRKGGRFGGMVFLFLPFVTPENRHSEYACDATFEQFLIDDLLEWAYVRYPSLKKGGHGLIGLSLSGLQAIWMSLRNPGVFSRVISQSPSAWYRDECLRHEIDPGAGQKTAFRISVGSRETSSGSVHQPGNLHQKTSQIESCGRLVEELRAAGHDVDHVVFHGDHDSIYWADEMPEALRWLEGE